MKPIRVIYTSHTYWHARALVKTLKELGYEAVAQQQYYYGDNSLHIFFSAFHHTHYPKNFIVYQTEQSTSGWFNNKYIDAMRKSLAVWEFAENHSEYYPDDIKEKLYHVPASIVEGRISVQKDIDCLFYGAMCQRRNNVISELERSGVTVTVLNGVFGEALYNYLSRAKTVVNIHYYEQAHLETFRVNEALACAAMPLCERTSDGYYPVKYDGLVKYWSNITELVNLINTNHNMKEYGCIDNTEHVKYAIDSLLVTT